MEKAIELAIKAGWWPKGKEKYQQEITDIQITEQGNVLFRLVLPPRSCNCKRKGYQRSLGLDINAFILDPLAWQALGKILEWKWDIEPHISIKNKPTQSIWCHEWLNLINYLASGGTTRDFFKELLTP